MESYNVIFTGRLADGKTRQQVEEKLLRLLKCPADSLEPFFQGKAIVAWKDLPHDRAVAYVEALTQAGALCRIQKSDQVARQADDRDKSLEGARPVKVVSPVLGPVRLANTPLLSPSLSAEEGGININRKDRTFIPFEDISLIAVTNDFGKGAPVLRVLVYLRSEKRPVIVDAEKIAFTAFPNVSGDNLLSSLRRLLEYLLEKNPRILIDDETQAVLQGSRPSGMKRNIDALATALAILAAENDGVGTSDAHRPAPLPPRPSVEKDAARQPPDLRTVRQQVDAAVKPPPTATEPSAVAPQPARGALKGRSIVYFALSLFFCLGVVSFISKIGRTDDPGRMNMTSSQMNRLFRGSPELERQRELLEYNRKGAKVTANVGMIVSAFLAFFFFRKGYRYWILYKSPDGNSP